MSLDPRPEYPTERRFVTESTFSERRVPADDLSHSYVLSVPPPLISLVVGWFWLIASGLHMALATIMGLFAMYSLRVPDYTGGPRVPDNRAWAVFLYLLIWLANAVRATGAWGLLRAENGTSRAKRAWTAVFVICLVQVVENYMPVMHLGYTSDPPRISPLPVTLAAALTLIALLFPQVLKWVFAKPTLTPTWEYSDDRGPEWAEAAALRQQEQASLDALLGVPTGELPEIPSTPRGPAEGGIRDESTPPLPVIPYDPAPIEDSPLDEQDEERTDE